MLPSLFHPAELSSLKVPLMPIEHAVDFQSFRSWFQLTQSQILDRLEADLPTAKQTFQVPYIQKRIPDLIEYSCTHDSHLRWLEYTIHYPTLVNWKQQECEECLFSPDEFHFLIGNIVDKLMGEYYPTAILKRPPPDYTHILIRFFDQHLTDILQLSLHLKKSMLHMILFLQLQTRHEKPIVQFLLKQDYAVLESLTPKTLSFAFCIAGSNHMIEVLNLLLKEKSHVLLPGTLTSVFLNLSPSFRNDFVILVLHQGKKMSKELKSEFFKGVIDYGTWLKPSVVASVLDDDNIMESLNDNMIRLILLNFVNRRKHQMILFDQLLQHDRIRAKLTKPFMNIMWEKGSLSYFYLYFMLEHGLVKAVDDVVLAKSLERAMDVHLHPVISLYEKRPELMSVFDALTGIRVKKMQFRFIDRMKKA